MERINQIWENTDFQKNLEQIRMAEENRIFCLHNMAHFLDVARIAALINEEEGYGLKKEIIYTTALLHDIGKHLQYNEGIPHEEASAKLAPDIMRECGYEEDEIEAVVEAIRNHRNKNVLTRKDLSGVIYRADKASRNCFACAVKEKCNWGTDKQNLKIRF